MGNAEGGSRQSPALHHSPFGIQHSAFGLSPPRNRPSRPFVTSPGIPNRNPLSGQGAIVKKTIIAMAFALAGTALVAQEASQSADPVIMKVGTTEIRKTEFEHALSALPAEYQAYASGPGKREFAEDYLRL